jgi:DNA-binding IclR family transcriptional regulator
MSRMESELEDAASERRYRAPALEKGLDILELLAHQGAPLTASQISVALDRSVSELFRMVQVLEFRGYIEATPDGEGYELTSKLFALAMTRAPVRSLLEVALPVMRNLAAELSQSCHLAVASDDQIVVVARQESPGYVGFSVRPGYRRPLVGSTSGAVLLAYLADRALLADPDFERRLEAIRARGYEQSPSSHIEGVVDVSAPILGDLGAVAALTIPFVQSRLAGLKVEDAVKALRLAAERISTDLRARS